MFEINTMGENGPEEPCDLSVPPDQYYILISETNYPPSQSSARCWGAAPLVLVQLSANHT